jgi:hypothetical protein
MLASCASRWLPQQPCCPPTPAPAPAQPSPAPPLDLVVEHADLDAAGRHAAAALGPARQPAPQPLVDAVDEKVVAHADLRAARAAGSTRAAVHKQYWAPPLLVWRPGRPAHTTSPALKLQRAHSPAEPAASQAPPTCAASWAKLSRWWSCSSATTSGSSCSMRSTVKLLPASPSSSSRILPRRAPAGSAAAQPGPPCRRRPAHQAPATPGRRAHLIGYGRSLLACAVCRHSL